LRNPIATIQTNVQLALTEPERDAQQQRLQAIERLAQRLSRLVGDLLFLARADSGTVETKRQSVPLDALLLAVVAEQEGVAARRGASLNLQLPESAPEMHESMAIAEDTFNLEGDWDQLARLFTNLIANSLEHAQPPKEKPLKIDVELQAVGDRKSPALEVRVRDNGCPLPPETRLRVFDRFYRESTHRSGANGSSGLGLAIARAIATNHRGQLRLQCSDLSGTIFTVTLPKVARGAMPGER
ncbi:MAG: HAMP domain-containing sensor histidine kinase, partial [Cyanobacteria bacterium J06641_5]